MSRGVIQAGQISSKEGSRLGKRKREQLKPVGGGGGTLSWRVVCFVPGLMTLERNEYKFTCAEKPSELQMAGRV